MARYNTVVTQTTASAATSQTSPAQGLFTELTGTSYTVNIADPSLFAGSSQSFWNNGSGTMTLSTPTGVFYGPSSSGVSTQPLLSGSTAILYSDGTNWINISSNGGPVTTSTLTANSTVTLSPSSASVTVNPGGSVTINPTGSVTINPATNVTISPTGSVTMNPTTAGSINNISIGQSTAAAGSFTTLAASSTLTVTGTLTANGSLNANGAFTAGSTFTANNTVTLSPANYNVTISPTGSGAVTISPTTAGSINNMSIGQTTAAAGTFNALTCTGTTTLQQISEVLYQIGSYGTSQSVGYTNGGIYYISGMTGNYTFNWTSVPTTTNRSFTLTLISSQGATPYVLTTLQINGTTITLNYAGGVTPTGRASKIDVISVVVYNLSGTFVGVGQLSSYG